MDKKFILKLTIIGAIFVIIVGTVWHFIYEWSGKSVTVGLFAPMNESVWEHLKLSTFPFLIFALIELYVLRKNRKNFWCAKAAESYLPVIFIPTVFYIYTSLAGHSILAVDITTFAVAVILGKMISYKLLTADKRQPAALPLIFLVILWASFILFTFRPPHLPPFEDPIEHRYGMANG